MLKTTAERLKYVRKHVLRISQAELGQKMGISAPAITHRENGNTNITVADADFFLQHYGISPIWLLYGTGDMRESALDVVRFHAPEYHLPPGCDKNMLRLRFREVVQEYMAAHRIDTVRELCENWDLNETQMSNALNEKHHRDVSLKMLMNALFYGSVNLNYVVCGKGEKFLSSKKSGTWQGGR